MTEPSCSTLPPTTPIRRALPRKASERDLNAVPPVGARSKSKPRTRPTTISHSPPAKPYKQSPGRGLTVRIEDGMAVAQSIQSAPAVRAVRPLPNVPMPPLPSSSQLIPTTPLTAPSSTMTNTQAQRALRPLPCPPLLGSAHSSPTPLTPPREEGTEIASLSSPVSPPPTERPRRVLKPLPIPGQNPKVEPSQLGRHIYHTPTRSLPSSPPTVTMAALKTPPFTAVGLPSLSDSKRAPDALFQKKSSPKRDACLQVEVDEYEGEESDIDISTTPLQNRIQLQCRGRPRLSNDSDLTSEDDDDDPFAEVVDLRRTKKDDDEDEDQVDYAWMLSNRILYRQGPHENQPSGKWVTEKKGKRITEDDYENILKALRTL